MSDQYPANFPIEIDRPLLKAYLRAGYMILWTLTLSILGALFGALSLTDSFDDKTSSAGAMVIMAIEHLAIGVGTGLVLGLLIYLLFFRWAADRMAANLEVTVEGPFLRIRQHAFALSDRKLHFRAIVDYATAQGPLMRHFGIHALQMTTTAGGATPGLFIFGVKDCLRVRDMLSEVDRLRED